MISDKRCRLCIWWDCEHERIKVAPQISGIGVAGLCRKHKPGSERVEAGYYLGVQPIMDAEDYCGEFREEVK